jgi:hypothetical protein
VRERLSYQSIRTRKPGESPASRRSFGLLKQPIAQLRQPGSVMREVALTHMASFDIKQASTMTLRCPVDPDEPLYIVDHR